MRPYTNDLASATPAFPGAVMTPRERKNRSPSYSPVTETGTVPGVANGYTVELDQRIAAPASLTVTAGGTQLVAVPWELAPGPGEVAVNFDLPLLRFHSSLGPVGGTPGAALSVTYKPLGTVSSADFENWLQNEVEAAQAALLALPAPGISTLTQGTGIAVTGSGGSRTVALNSASITALAKAHVQGTDAGTTAAEWRINNGATTEPTCILSMPVTFEDTPYILQFLASSDPFRILLRLTDAAGVPQAEPVLLAAGRLAGDGSSITALNGAELQAASVPAAALASGTWAPQTPLLIEAKQGIAAADSETPGGVGDSLEIKAGRGGRSDFLTAPAGNGGDLILRAGISGEYILTEEDTGIEGQQGWAVVYSRALWSTGGFRLGNPSSDGGVAINSDGLSIANGQIFVRGYLVDGSPIPNIWAGAPRGSIVGDNIASNRDVHAIGRAIGRKVLVGEAQQEFEGVPRGALVIWSLATGGLDGPNPTPDPDCQRYVVHTDSYGTHHRNHCGTGSEGAEGSVHDFDDNVAVSGDIIVSGDFIVSGNYYGSIDGGNIAETSLPWSKMDSSVGAQVTFLAKEAARYAVTEVTPSGGSVSVDPDHRTTVVNMADLAGGGSNCSIIFSDTPAIGETKIITRRDDSGVATESLIVPTAAGDYYLTSGYYDSVTLVATSTGWIPTARGTV